MVVIAAPDDTILEAGTVTLFPPLMLKVFPVIDNVGAVLVGKVIVLPPLTLILFPEIDSEGCGTLKSKLLVPRLVSVPIPDEVIVV